MKNVYPAEGLNKLFLSENLSSEEQKISKTLFEEDKKAILNGRFLSINMSEQFVSLRLKEGNPYKYQYVALQHLIFEVYFLKP